MGTQSLLLRYHPSVHFTPPSREMNTLAYLPARLLALLSLAALVSMGPGALSGSDRGAVWEGVRTSADTLEVVGRVVDREGEGVAWARVQIVDEGRVLAGASSEADGHFRVMARGWRLVDPVLRVERMGFAPLEEALPREGALERILVLDSAPIALPALEVSGGTAACEAPETRTGTDFLERATELHTLDLDTLGVASYTLARTDTLPEGIVVDRSHVSDESLEPGQRSSAPLLRISWERRVDREGYAFPVRRTHRNGSYDSWSYAPLEADFSGHFLSEGFRGLHHLSPPEPHLDGGWDIDFCPRDDSRPGLQGRLTFTADTLLLRAEWRFVTPEPHEGAGGRISFPAVDHDGTVRLLPDESLTWRRLPDGSLQRRAQWYEGWILSAGDSVPFLPGRNSGG